jgi:hypothetical protein
MNQEGTIRELDAGEDLAPGEIMLSHETAARLKRMTVAQRQRFYKACRHGATEDEALMRVASRP